ncbi:receptor-like protein EIX2 [Bidens hawaiensis]|uniref:receptor-like protein EIX2 n=1 Tax=Bidens hawaiensis TaxID=980011 RepID=UPI0040497172
MDEERQALLEFKHGLIDEGDQLASWVEENSNCCSWTGIVCDNFTGHVEKINLPGNCHTNDIIPGKDYEECLKRRLKGDLSPSLLHLKQLKHIDLSSNDFGGIHVPRFMGSLGKLRYLNLSSSNFGGSIPPQLGNLSELRILCLGSFLDKDLESTSIMNMKWLSGLGFLHHLDMSGINLSKAVDWLQVINTLPSLVELHLSGCKLSNMHPHVRSHNLTSLSLLDLSFNFYHESIMPQWIFNIASLVTLDISWCHFLDLDHSGIDIFHNLTSLEFLHISGNNFMNSSLVLKGLSKSVGSNLISLDISSCSVSSSDLDALHNLTSLLSLDLSKNQLTRTIPKSLGNLCNLRHLHLAENNFSNISLESLLEIFFECHPSSMESLSVESTKISGQLPHALGEMIYLEILQLGNNRIAGMIPYSIGRPSFLRVLDLDENLIFGQIPNSIGELSSLEWLDLSDNRLNGSLPNSLGQLSRLIGLDISNNFLNGVVAESHFATLARLHYLDGFNNNLTLRSHQENLIPSPRLVFLSLSNWNLGPHFPIWLQKHKNLEYLEISNTGISSPMPETFLRSLTGLRYLDMSQNHIQGMLLSIPSAIKVLDLSYNDFGGQLPKLLSDSSISNLDLSYNSFKGSLGRLLCSSGGEVLKVLNLANNLLSGLIPECWVKFPNLSFLYLANNNLSGRIPTTLGFLSSLRSLNMCDNKLSGRLHVSIQSLTKLRILQLARNELVGNIPAWFGRELLSLSILNLRSNNFDGHLNHQLCNLTKIQILDLADNNLSGNIPRCLNNFNVLNGKENTPKGLFEFSPDEDMHTSDSASFVTKGQEYTYGNILGLVMILDLSSNEFSGSIPSELMALQALQSLNLSRNQLMGKIPENIGDLKLLESFDVSMNHLSGELPTSLSSLSFLSSFNVSFNNLTGRIPTNTQLQGFNESSFMGNKLCGEPLTKSCAVVTPDRDQEEEDASNGADWGLIISIVSGFIVGFWVVLLPLIVSTSWRIAYFSFLRKMWYIVCDAIRKYSCKVLHK